ncbi:hypothetical protein, partial [Citrobacter werkmanii]|uniref:hypothetical protein n=1 Tax=Citrobacter werkmanii TaxID=67827 RepID=UPI001C2CFBAC
EESEAEGVTVGVVPTKVAGKVSPTSLEKYRFVVPPLGLLVMDSTVLVNQQINVPSANLMYSPFELEPRSIIAPVGAPPVWDTAPTIAFL